MRKSLLIMSVCFVRLMNSFCHRQVTAMAERVVINEGWIMLHFTQDGLKLSPSLSYRESFPQEQKISIPQKKDFQDVFPILCRFVGQSLFVSSYPSLRWQMTPFLLPAESCGHCSHLGLQMSECQRQSKGGGRKMGTVSIFAKSLWAVSSLVPIVLPLFTSCFDALG